MSSSDGIIARVAAAVSDAPGVVAVALGGSRARSWHHDTSDIDIGLYYRGSAGGLDSAALSAIAETLDDERRRDLACPHGGWGAWVDGGAWMRVEGVSVDLIYRDLDRVDGAIGAAERGAFQIAYHLGHPHGFVSAAYAGEAAICKPLHDPSGALARRKARVATYPEALRSALMQRFLDEATFTLPLLRKGEARGDAVYAAGCAFRIAACLCQALFALNREWLINEKGAAPRAGGFAHAPASFAERSADPRAAVLEALIEETRRLCFP